MDEIWPWWCYFFQVWSWHAHIQCMISLCMLPAPARHLTHSWTLDTGYKLQRYNNASMTKQCPPLANNSWCRIWNVVCHLPHNCAYNCRRIHVACGCSYPSWHSNANSHQCCVYPGMQLSLCLWVYSCTEIHIAMLQASPETWDDHAVCHGLPNKCHGARLSKIPQYINIEDPWINMENSNPWRWHCPCTL